MKIKINWEILGYWILTLFVFAFVNKFTGWYFVGFSIIFLISLIKLVYLYMKDVYDEDTKMLQTNIETMILINEYMYKYEKVLDELAKTEIDLNDVENVKKLFKLRQKAYKTLKKVDDDVREYTTDNGMAK